MKYSILFSGKLLPGYDARTVVSALLAQGIKKETIKSILVSPNTVIKKSDSFEQIERVCNKLIGCGLDCRITHEEQPADVKLLPVDVEQEKRSENFYVVQPEQFIAYLLTKKWGNLASCWLIVFAMFFFSLFLINIPVSFFMNMVDFGSHRKLFQHVLCVLFTIPYIFFPPFFAKYAHILLKKLGKKDTTWYCITPVIVTLLIVIASFEIGILGGAIAVQHLFACYWYCKMLILGPEKFIKE